MENPYRSCKLITRGGLPQYFFPEINPGTGKQIQSLNWQVVNCTTPANYFHVLRRQVFINPSTVVIVYYSA